VASTLALESAEIRSPPAKEGIAGSSFFHIAGGYHGIDVLRVVDCLTAVRANKKISQNMIDLTAGVAGPSQLERSHESVDLRWRTGEEIPTLHIGSSALA
jgi:hypothetical protein